MKHSNCSREFVAIHEPGLDTDLLASALADGIEGQALTVDSAKLADELRDILTTIQ